MSNIQRYDCCVDSSFPLVVSPDGDWVEYKDLLDYTAKIKSEWENSTRKSAQIELSDIIKQVRKDTIEECIGVCENLYRQDIVFFADLREAAKDFVDALRELLQEDNTDETRLATD